jgi:prepilin-type N-terminal cleavage/methylation domain-containing protein
MNAPASVMPPSRIRPSVGAGRRAFTLVELIVVMTLLLTVASLVMPRMATFFRGRALSQEAQRMLSLINYGRARAVAEGVPVILWIDPVRSTYGLEVQESHTAGDDGARRVVHTAEPSLRLEVPVVADAPVSEQEDERLGLPENLAAIRWNPDGFFDEGGAQRIIIRQADEAALEIAPTLNRLGFEIRPLSRNG